MRLRTLKKFIRERRKTVKSGGGGNTFKLRADAEEYIPTSNKSKSNNIKNLSSKMESIRINNSDLMTSFTSHWLKMREKIENAVAIDCEMVGVYPGNKSALAHVAIVDFNGRKIYDKYVIPNGGIESITDYRTDFSGITPEKLVHLNKKEHSFKTVKQEVHSILKDKMIVGHGLTNDFKVLEFSPSSDMIWDTTLIEKYLQNHPFIPGKKQPRKLKVISKEFANNNIQKSDKTGHSPLEDARASMNLYRLSFSYPKIIYENMAK
jgi:RNA exonuclease 4